MTRVFTDDGRSVPVTIVQANPNFINRIKTKNTDGYDAIQVTTGQKIKKLSNTKSLPKPYKKISICSSPAK